MPVLGPFSGVPVYGGLASEDKWHREWMLTAIDAPPPSLLSLGSYSSVAVVVRASSASACPKKWVC
jgi:hypothetical protein